MPDFNPGPRSPFSDAEERKLASDLLEVASEAEVEQVLGDLLKRASRGAEPVGSKSTALSKDLSRQSRGRRCRRSGLRWERPWAHQNATKTQECWAPS